MRRKHPMKPVLAHAGSSLLSRVVLFVLVALALYGVYRIIKPFIAPIIMALFLVTIFHPFYERLKRRVGGRDTIAAALAVASVFLVVVIPFLLFSAALIQQGIEIFRHIQDWVAQGNLDQVFSTESYQELMSRPQVERIRSFLDAHFARPGEEHFDIGRRLVELSRTTVEYLGKQILPLLSKTGLIFMNFFIMFFIMFYAFRDGAQMLDYLMQIVPLSRSHERLMVERIRYVSRAVLLGVLLTASVQSVIAMIGFRIVGVPALFWGVMLGVASLVPIVGTTLVWVPICLYLFAIGNTGSALFLLAWCAAGVSSVDNFLRPYFMQGRSGMSTIILFFALLGGIRLFGPIGILYGPLIFGLCAVILYIYRIENSAILTKLEQS